MAESVSRYQQDSSGWLNRADSRSVGATEYRAPDRVSGIIKSILGAQRSALDFLANALRSPSQRKQNDAGFAISCASADYPNKQARPKLKGLSQEAQDAIYDLQPFHDPRGLAWHPLWQLNEMRNADHHREPHAVITALVSSTISLTHGPVGVEADFSEIELPHGLSFDEEQLVARRVVVLDCDGNADPANSSWHPALGFAVIFGPDTPLPYYHVLTTIRGIQEYIQSVVFADLEPLLT